MLKKTIDRLMKKDSIRAKYRNPFVKFMCFALIFLLSINSFAAVVSDNDGSAFVTKAEFDALKNNFSKQIADYNSSIDNKIDGSIAQYLNGIKRDNPPTNYWERLMTETSNNFWWQNYAPTGDSTLTNEVFANITRELYQRSWQAKVETGGAAYGMWANTGDYKNIRHWIHVGSGEWSADSPTDGWTYGKRTDQLTGVSWWRQTGTADNQHKILQFNCHVETKSGSGQRWILHKNPDNTLIIRKFCTSYYPVLSLSVWDHVSQQVNNKDSMGADHGRDYKTTGTGTAPSLTEWTSKTDNGPKITGQNATNRNTVSIAAFLNVVSDNKNYEYINFAGNSITEKTITYSLDTAKPKIITTGTLPTITCPATTFYDMYHYTMGEKSQTNDFYGYTLTYNNYNSEYSTMKINGIHSNIVSSISGQNVNVGEGCILGEANGEATQMKIAIKFKARTSGGAASSSKVHFIISDKKFKSDGTVDTANGGKKLYEASVDPNVMQNIIVDSKDHQQFWINLYSEGANCDATIDAFSIKV